MMKTSELLAGFIISALFYYLLVVIPDKRKYKTVQTRIRKLIESSQTEQYRVISNLIEKTGYGKSYEELNKEDFKLILVKMDEIIIENKKEFTQILRHWHQYTVEVEKYLNKVLMYYKERLSEEALVQLKIR
ncbi:hypothetical protein OKW24_005669 [Peribacillus simplex]|uniref:hypothetical protein n=1 Tax=Peribacillus simplex TaxID=1478 RepID=UPI0024E242A3|nr:hypothetical protein [Peribacillus simplex]MDF9763773.1 hypothetical protein [Peribacillus simplex]